MSDIFVLDDRGKVVPRLDRESSTSKTPATESEVEAVGPCDLHPGWRPQLRGPQPRQLASLCPYCRREVERKHESSRPVLHVPHPQQVRDTGKIAEAGAVYRERLEEAGQVLPGSSRESAALERMSELRQEERQREALRGRSPAAIAARHQRHAGHWRKHARG